MGKNEGENALLQEPLLNGSASNGIESNKSGGGETVTPYSNNSFFSVLTFSWMGNLIAAGSKKTFGPQGCFIFPSRLICIQVGELVPVDCLSYCYVLFV
ncbi:unnamed protein product [Ilex paraguariensis]|uniref:Uncharacterized protein n=1 Tax=Ilex paraguariensis TaxID=185542 RepID=A0ABC8SFT0_9AQUA